MNTFQQYHQRYLEIKAGMAGELTDESFSNFILCLRFMHICMLDNDIFICNDFYTTNGL